MSRSNDVRRPIHTSARRACTTALALSLALVAGSVFAQAQAVPTIFYPTKEQSAKQQEQDKFECYGWAKQQSGIDPAQAGSGNASAQNARDGGSTAGGLVVGALGGGLLARKKEQQAQMAAQQQAAQQQQARAQLKAVYDRAYGAGMEARGYVGK